MKEDISEKLKLIIDAAGKLSPGSVTHIGVKHDDGCLAIKTQRLADCTCQPVVRNVGQLLKVSIEERIKARMKPHTG